MKEFISVAPVHVRGIPLREGKAKWKQETGTEILNSDFFIIVSMLKWQQQRNWGSNSRLLK